MNVKNDRYTVCVKVELFYEFDFKEFPEFATPEGVAQLVESAFNDHGPVGSLQDFEARLGKSPVEIDLRAIEEA